jgi:hypothetical protein
MSVSMSVNLPSTKFHLSIYFSDAVTTYCQLQTHGHGARQRQIQQNRTYERISLFNHKNYFKNILS